MSISVYENVIISMHISMSICLHVNITLREYHLACATTGSSEDENCLCFG